MIPANLRNEAVRQKGKCHELRDRSGDSDFVWVRPAIRRVERPHLEEQQMKLRKLTGRQVDRIIYVAFWATLVCAVAMNALMLAFTAYIYISTM